MRYNNVDEITFKVVFWRKFALSILIFGIISILGINVTSKLTKKYISKSVENITSQLSLSCLKVVTSDMEPLYKNYLLNLNTAKQEDVIKNTAFVYDAAIFVLDETNKKTEVSSYSCIDLNAAAIAWWMKETGTKSGYPTISTPEGLMDFCLKYSHKKLAFKDLYLRNAVLMPSGVVAYDENGTKIDEVDYSVSIYNISQKTKSIGMEQSFDIVGNKDSDMLYTVLKDEYIKDGKFTMPTFVDNEENYFCFTVDFGTEDTDYKTIVCYKYSFWKTLMFMYIGFNVLGIALCVVISTIHAKHVLKVKNLCLS